VKEQPSTVFIVDDDRGVRDSLRILLKTVGIPNAAYPSAGDFLEGYAVAQPGCLLLDIRMPGMSGLDLQGELARQGANLPIIFITGHGDVPMAVEAMQRGAFDFLQKPFRDQELIDKVQRALERDRETRRATAEHEQLRARLKTLTPREREVLGLLIRGKQNKVMANELGLSQRTVEIHRAHVMSKMAVNSVAELVRAMMTIEGALP
jgi:two-component system response regulator FixJ